MKQMSMEEFQADMALYQMLNKDERFSVREDKLEICLNDKYDINASFN